MNAFSYLRAMAYSFLCITLTSLFVRFVRLCGGLSVLWFVAEFIFGLLLQLVIL